MYNVKREAFDDKLQLYVDIASIYNKYKSIYTYIDMDVLGVKLSKNC